MKDLLKKMLLAIWNPCNVRDSKGIIIDDLKRKNHSRGIKKKIDNGDIILSGDGNRCYSVQTKSKIIVKKQDKR